MTKGDEIDMEKLLKIKLTREELDRAEAAALAAGYNPRQLQDAGRGAKAIAH